MNNSIPKEKQKQYADYVKQITPTHSLPMNMAKAFLTGGAICVVGQIITNFAKSRGLDQDMAGTWCSVTLVFISVILTGFNVYPKIGKFGGAGSLVPITGFANSVAAPAIEYWRGYLGSCGKHHAKRSSRIGSWKSRAYSRGYPHDLRR